MWVSPIFERFSEFLDKLSYYYLADELEGTYRGMMIALPPEDWPDFRELSLEQLSSLLQDWGSNLKLSAFTTSPRKPKKKNHKTYISTYLHFSLLFNNKGRFKFHFFGD